MANNYNLFLDDIRNPADTGYTGKIGFYVNTSWVIVRNYDQFCKEIASRFEADESLPDLVSFDHDLADEHYHPSMGNVYEYNTISKNFKEKTGMDCAKWLVDYCLDNGFDLPTCWVHSANPVGKRNIQSYLANAEKHLFSK
jgi:hypothetical protein